MTPQARGFHTHTDTVVDHYAPLVAKALGSMWTKQEVTNAIRKASSSVQKADTPTDPIAAAAAKALGSGDTSALARLLPSLYGDAYLQGAHEAAHAAGGTIVASLKGVTAQLPDDYWNQWTPGYGEAAAKTADGGLARLLDDANVTIKGVEGSATDRLGNDIAAGIARGDSVDVIAQSVMESVADPQRAWLIADTETARAMTAANLDTYAQNGVEQVEWLAEDDACPECEDNADASPIALGDDWPNGDVPVHPACRCAIAPYVAS